MNATNLAEDIQLSPSPFQNLVLGIDFIFDLFLGGGRGGAKSWAIAWLIYYFVLKFPNQRILYVRKTYAGLQDFELICRKLFYVAYNGAARYNSTNHVWQFPNGCTLELGQLDHISDYDKYQGRSFALICVDEAGQYADPFMIDMLRSNLRAEKSVPTRFVIAANPGGVGHAWIAKRYVFIGAQPWAPFTDEISGSEFVSCPSTYLDNPFIDQEQYLKQLKSSCPFDDELLKAWISGDWTVARGAYFASVLSEEQNIFNPWLYTPNQYLKTLSVKERRLEKKQWSGDWEYFLTHDYGSSAPSVTYCIARSPGAEHEGKYFPRGSLILFDELATNSGDQLNVGKGWTVPTTAKEIIGMCERWNIEPNGVADDAIFSNHGSEVGTIADEFRDAGVYFEPVGKGSRINGWEKMRTLLSQAGSPDLPGLYISRACSYFWATVPYLARDPKRVEDLDSSGPDHAADAVRYGCLHELNEVNEVQVTNWI